MCNATIIFLCVPIARKLLFKQAQLHKKINKTYFIRCNLILNATIKIIHQLKFVEENHHNKTSAKLGRQKCIQTKEIKRNVVQIRPLLCRKVATISPLPYCFLQSTLCMIFKITIMLTLV